MRKYLLFIAMVAIGLFFTSCLTVEKKQYTFEFTGKNTGKLTIKYINIMSSVDSAGYTEMQDFNDLLDNYLNGNKIEESYPGAKNITKRLFEENGVLNAEVTMEFPDLAAARLYQMDKKSPIMFYASGVDGETYVESNGTYGGEIMPIVMFSAKEKKLVVTTSISKPSDDSFVSLLPQYRNMKKQ